MTFTETYLKFNKATAFMQENPELRESNFSHFQSLCDQLDTLWEKAKKSERTAWASQLVAEGVDNLVIHYTLYGKSKEQWNN